MFHQKRPSPETFSHLRPWPGSWLTKEPQKIRSCVVFEVQDFFCSKAWYQTAFGFPPSPYELGPQNLKGPKIGFKKKHVLVRSPLRDFLRFGAWFQASSPWKSDVPFLQTKIPRWLDGSPQLQHTPSRGSQPNVSTKIQSLTQTQEHPWFVRSH